MAHTRGFRKCETCGSHGHGGRGCPVFRLNQQQERRREQRRRDLSFGLTPELERDIILIRKAWKIAAALGSILLCATSLFAGTITGRLQTATGGSVTNGTLSFRLSQPAVLVGSASIVTSPASCYISSAGNIAGVPDPLVAPVLTANTISGTFPAGTYFVVLTYAGASGESVASPESTVVLSAQGTVIVAAPVRQPSNATGYNVYIGTASGTETLQASVTGFTQYSQTSALASGAALPASNSSVCSLAFSDQLIPSGTYYAVSLVNKNGSAIAGFPQTWCIFGGQSGTINVSNGAPTGNCGTNGVIYPTPIFAAPLNNAPQSISSPMTFTAPVTFTSLPIFNGGLSITGTVSGSATYTTPSLTSPTSTGTDNGTETLVNKSLTSPTSSGTDNGTETLVNKTLTSPTVNGTIPGTLPATNLTLAGTLTNYNSIATVGNGVASEVALVDVPPQSGAIGTTTLYNVPASGAGQYRIIWDSKVTTAAGTSSTLGPLTITYTDPDGTVISTTMAGVGVNPGTGIGESITTNTTSSVLFGFPVILNCKASTVIQYAFGYASNAANAMQYNLHIRLEAM